MRILTLRLGDRPPFQLHRHVTMLGGLDEATRRDVVAALASLARGKAGDGVSAELEAHGILLDAAPPTLDALGLPIDIEPVVHGDDLPGGREAILAKAAEAAIADAEAALEGKAAEHREAVAAAEEEVPEAGPDVDALRHALEAATTRRIGAEAALADLQNAHRSAVADLEGAVTAARERAEAARSALEQRPVVDPEPVATALQALEDVLGASPQPLPEAIELADRLDSLHTDADEPAEEPEAVRAARARVDTARAAVEATVSQRDDDVVDPDDVAELERVHAAREEAEAQVERSRIHLPGARRKLVAAQKAEREVLDRLGLPSYGAYLIRASTMLVQSEDAPAAREAVAELTAAEAALDELLSAPADDGNAERDTAVAEARSLLGPDAPDGDTDLVAALRARTAPPPDPSEAAGELVLALERVGESAAADDPEALADRARRWLGEGPLRAERATALEEERDRLDADLAAAEERRDRAGDEHRTAVEAATRDLEEARIAETDARRALEAATGQAAAAASAELDRRAAAVAIAEAALAAARAEAEAARAAAPLPPTDEPARPATVDDLEVWFLSRLAGLRAPSCTGPAPLVLDDALAGLPDDLADGVLRLLERASTSHQVVYVGDDDRVRRWAGSLGVDVAKVT